MANECEVVHRIRIGRGNWGARREPVRLPLHPPQIPHNMTSDGTQAATVGGRWLTAWARAQSWHISDALSVGMLEVKVRLSLFKHHAMKAYGGVNVQIHIFLTSALAGGEWSASRPGRFTPGQKAPGTHWIRGWVDPRASLDDVEKILDPTGTRTPTLRSSGPHPVAIPTTLSPLLLFMDMTFEKIILLWTMHYSEASPMHRTCGNSWIVGQDGGGTHFQILTIYTKDAMDTESGNRKMYLKSTSGGIHRSRCESQTSSTIKTDKKIQSHRSNIM
jgi:hypothetical protein